MEEKSTDIPNNIKVVEFQSQSYTSYPTDSSSSHCIFNFFYSVVDDSTGPDVGINNLYSNYTNNPNYFDIFSDDQKSSVVYLRSIDIDSGSYTFSLIFSSNSGTNSTYYINLQCNVIDFSKVEIQIKDLPVFIGDHHYSTFEVKGLEHTSYTHFMTSHGPAFKLNSNQYLFIWAIVPMQQGILNTWSVDISFESKFNYTVTSNNPYRDNIEIVSITDVKRYPLVSNVVEFGNLLTPIMTFKSNSTKRQPYQQNGGKPPVAISGTQGDIKYATFFSSGSYDVESNVNFTFQSGLTAQSFSTSYILTKYNSPYSFTSLLVEFIGDQYLPLFKCSFGSNDYHQLGFQYDYLRQKIIKRFPFGFISGSNLNYGYSVIFQRSYQSPSSSIFIASNELLTTNLIHIQVPPISNDVDSNPPRLLSYSFTQISSLAYILTLNLYDQAGISHIIFEGEQGPRESSKLVGGDIYNGTYEFIVQATSTKSFEVYDYNNNILKFSHGNLLNINPPLIFNVPDLLLKDIGFSDFTDFQFAENDLNLNNQPSHNILYFNLTSDYPIGKPMGLIINQLLSYDQIIPIVWNETLKMYNVKFIVPKNIQFGVVDWKIMPSERILLHSSQFPDSYQLRVNSSYLDNYGPIFTGIQYFNDTTIPPLGWKLRIKDDFNGFSHGYIRVFGSVDNTNYNFNFTIVDVLSGGDKMDGFYNIHLPSSATANIIQDYIMTYVLLVDSNNIESIFSVYEHGIDPIFNPFINFLKNPQANILNVNDPAIGVTTLTSTVPPTSTTTTPTTTSSTGVPYSTSGDSGQAGSNPISSTTSSTTISSGIRPTAPSSVMVNDDNYDKELYVVTNDLGSSSGYDYNYDLYSKQSTSTTTGIGGNGHNGGSNNQLSRKLLATQPDTSAPLLIAFKTSTTSIDVGSNNRVVIFDFEATDPDSGLKNDQYPIVYLIGKRMEILECISTIVETTATNAIYTCKIELPVGWGYPGALLLSVYGFINNGGSYSGFDTNQLISGFPSHSTINTTMSFTTPLILSNIKITSMDEELIIYGKSFDLVIAITVEYYNELGGLLLTERSIFFEVFGNSAIKFSIRPNPNPIVVFLNTGSVHSNHFKITPTFFNNSLQYVPWNTQPPKPTTPDSPTPSVTTLPTNTPIKCIGNPECGGPSKGYCRDSGCVCLSPWVGNDCLSKVIIVPQPPKNSTSPTIVIPIIGDGSDNNNEDSNDSILFKSLISIVSIRELDFNGNQIKLFQFDKWIFTEINDKKNQYQTSITKESTNGKPMITTNITVVLEWFEVITIIQFAESNLTMNPSTIKYTIDVTEYPFSSALNSLQLIMSASFESSKEDICSTKEFGSTSSGDNSNYLKIQIEDHSLYGRFIKRAIVDNIVTTITNELLDESLNSITTSSKLQSFIGITMPNYQTSITIDPDFSVLLDNNPVSSNDNNSICKPSSGLTTAQLAGVIVGSVAFASVIAVSTAYYLKKKKQHAKFMDSMQSKLKNIKNN